MNILLKLSYLFFVGSTVGWVIELFFSRFFSAANPKRKWINPGFCIGPYLPLYGFGLCILYLIASVEQYGFIENTFLNKCFLFLLMAVCMTAIEYIAGVLVLKIAHIRLWDYSGEWRNFLGIICPKFSVIWACLGAVYYFFIHPYILSALDWLSHNLAFSFVIGFFFGVFIIDVLHSTNFVANLKKYAEENEVIIRYEALKLHIHQNYDNKKAKYNFFGTFHSDKPLYENLRELKETFERKKHR